MKMSFLTLEDYNSINLHNVNEFYTLNTELISTDEFENVLFDFTIVSHEVNNSNHIFTFEVHNSLWHGSYYLLKADGTILDVNPNYDLTTKSISVTTAETSVKLVLYLCSFDTGFNFQKLQYIFNPLSDVVIRKDEIGESKSFEVTGTDGTSYSDEDIVLNTGVLTLQKNNTPPNYILCMLKKTDLLFNLDNLVLQNGIINHVNLNVDNEYLPNGSLVGDELLDVTVKFGKSNIPVTYDEDNMYYYFDLDLTEKFDNKPIVLEIVVNENDYVNPSNNLLTIPVTYATVSSFSELSSQIVMGAEVIELTDNIIFEEDLILPHQLYVIGDNFNIEFERHGFIVNENVNVKFDNVRFVNGSPCFVQSAGSKLVLNDCVFEDAVITDEHKGSIIYGLNYENIITELNGCSILNCPHSIYHCGELSVNNIKARYNNYDEDYIDNDYPMFLTIYDGQANITNSIFDIDYTTSNICTNQIDIKFAQSLIGIGENAIVNGYSSNQLKTNDSLHLTDSPYNNQSHVYCKYYYPSVETCVITSPKENYEDKAVCHSILGEDYIYKNNVQVTRADSETENNNRKIIWED